MTNDAQKLIKLNERIDKIKQRKIEAVKEVEMLQKQYNQMVEELKSLGIDKAEDLDSTVTDLEQQLKQTLAEAEALVSELEKNL